VPSWSHPCIRAECDPDRAIHGHAAHQTARYTPHRVGDPATKNGVAFAADGTLPFDPATGIIEERAQAEPASMEARAPTLALRRLGTAKEVPEPVVMEGPEAGRSQGLVRGPVRCTFLQGQRSSRRTVR